jgi:hypothetical protein
MVLVVGRIGQVVRESTILKESTNDLVIRPLRVISLLKVPTCARATRLRLGWRWRGFLAQYRVMDAIFPRKHGPVRGLLFGRDNIDCGWADSSYISHRTILHGVVSRGDRQ